MVGFAFLIVTNFASNTAQAQKHYDVGASDAEIRIGQTAPYSGPLSSAGQIGLTVSAYIAKVNESGGVNGRKITFLSVDDAFSPPKAVEQVRRLVEQDEVLAMFDQFGTPTSIATQKYLNAKKIPQLFAGTGSSRLSDPAFPWSSSILPSYVDEGRILGNYTATTIKNAKVAILFQNDDVGKDYVRGFKEAISGAPSLQVVKEISYEPLDPTVDSQISTLAASGADVFLNLTTGRATAQSIRALSNTLWRPLHLMNGRWADIGSVFKPVGVDKAVGIISAQYMKSATDPSWNDDPAMKEYKAFMQKYRVGADPDSSLNLSGYLYGQLLVHLIREAGDNLTRENINRIALNLKDVDFGLLLPSVKISTTESQRHLIQRQILTRFDGTRFVPLD
jgi:branched-chain amino acid transport system substrate-binding protein